MCINASLNNWLILQVFSDSFSGLGAVPYVEDTVRNKPGKGLALKEPGGETDDKGM